MQDAARARDAEQKFQQGLAALQRGESERARTLLGEAARLVPQQARYRAHFGRVLALDKASRRQAESELQGPVAPKPRHVSYPALLAAVDPAGGLRRKAQA